MNGPRRNTPTSTLPIAIELSRHSGGVPADVPVGVFDQMQAATLESVNAMAWGMAVPGVTCAPDGACPAGTLAVMMCLMEQGPHCAHLEANPGQRAVLLGGSGAGPLCLPCWHERRAELEAYVVKGTRCDGCDASPDEMSTVAYPFGPMTVVGTLCSVCLAVACPSPKERERRWRKRNDS